MHRAVTGPGRMPRQLLSGIRSIALVSMISTSREISLTNLIPSSKVIDPTHRVCMSWRGHCRSRPVCMTAQNKSIQFDWSAHLYKSELRPFPCQNMTRGYLQLERGCNANISRWLGVHFLFFIVARYKYIYMKIVESVIVQIFTCTSTKTH